jgi:ATP-binding cassette subfamily B protein
MRRSHFPETEATSFNWRVMAMVWPYLLEFKSRIVLGFMCLILTKVASVYLPFLLKDIVDGLSQANSKDVILTILGIVAAYGCVRFANVMFGEIRDTLFGRVTERAVRRIALNVFKHLHNLDLDFHLNRRTGGLSRDIERGTTGIAFVMRFMVFNIVPTFIEIALVIGLLFYNYGIWFALITLLSVIAYVAFSVVATEWRTEYVRQANKADSSSNTRAIDSLINYETVKYFTNENYEAKAYDKNLAEFESAKRKNRLSLFGLNGGQAFIISLAITFMLGLAAYQVSLGQMTIGDFVLVNAFMMQLFMPLNFLGFVYREIKSSLANIEHLFELLKVKPKVIQAPDATELKVSKGNITFEQVAFAYNKERPIIKPLDFSVSGGEKIAVVGDSGAGKSTLVKLLFRFYDASSGRVLIDGQDIKTLTLESLRRAIGIVPQDTVLFNDSILENIRYGDPSAPDEAHLKSFIDSLPEGVNTKVGERGLKLSGGEKQRIAIARTILKRPPILVFDEATSSLDSHAEQAILKAMEEVSKGHTSIAIAHRLSTVVNADRIIVLKAGAIVEQGTHQQLLAEEGHYASMWQLQQSQENDNDPLAEANNKEIA